MRNQKLDHILLKIEKSKQNLDNTRAACFLYFAVLQDLPRAVEDTKAMVSSIAALDWGEGTHCSFTESEVIVENFDGRREVITKEEREN